MCEDIRTPASDEIVHNEHQQRRFTSFYISDILAERSSEMREEIFEEASDLGGDDTQEETSLKGANAKEDSKCNSTETKTSSQQDENGYSNLKSRSPFLAEQREILEKIFQESKYISSCKRKQLASELKLSERQIKTWFQNRRTKFRKVRGNDGLRRQETWSAEHGGVAKVLSNVDGGMNGLPKDWVITLYKLLSKS